MFKSIRRVISHLVAMDSYYTARHPLLYPFLKMTALFVLIQIFVQAMYHISEAKSDAAVDDTSHPPNNLSLFLVDHTPLQLVEDGSFKKLHKLLGTTDIAMVMVYAPWCFHSNKLAKTFAELAKNQEEILFVAINCWDPQGECRRGEGAIMYPRISIRHKHISTKMEYFGDMNYQSLLSYSHRLIRPLMYLTSVEQFNKLLEAHEFLVVGYFNFSSSSSMPIGYKDYYLASLLGLQTDYFRGSTYTPLMCVVTSSDLAESLLLSSPPPSISLIGIHRGVMQSLPVGGITPNGIHHWININCTRHRLVNEFVPRGDVSHLLTTPVFFLFLPLREGEISRTLSKYVSAAQFINRSSTQCTDLSHLSHTSCPMNPFHQHFSLPLCHSNPLTMCPKYNPLYRHASSLLCQEEEREGLVTGGWPPPCTHVRTSFYYVDSLKYPALAESMGVSSVVVKEAEQFVIFVDFKSRLQFFFPVVEETIEEHEFSEMLEHIVIGKATPLYRNGCGHSDATKCSFLEITTDQFISLTMPRPLMQIQTQSPAVLVVHYVSWCASCVHLWPVLHSINSMYRNHTHLTIARINGDFNDIPRCHAPKYYPSIALYKYRGSHPIWFPENATLSVEQILDFLQTHLPLVSRSDQRETAGELKEVEQWERMGWDLWEISEKEKRSLEEANMKLGKEAGLLRERIAILEQQQKEAAANNHGDSVVNLQSLIDQVTKIIINEKSDSEDHFDSGSDDQAVTGHTHSDVTSDKCDYEQCNS